MKIKIKRIDKSLPLPAYQTAGSVAFDLMARVAVTILPGAIGYVPLNVCIGTPKGFMLMIAARSSLHKRGLMLSNGVVIGDQDFCGNGDEYKAVLYNFSDKSVTVERGDRLVQGTFVPVLKCAWNEVDEMSAEDRGGIGSTG
ncbi:MAG: dUTP diphosphatase [bacterium]|nr:dUTP diphosphatase [bacterium]